MDELGVHILEIGEDEELLEGGVVAYVAILIRTCIAPFTGGLAEKGDIEHVGFVGVGDGGLFRGDLVRDETEPNSIGVDAVVDLGEGAVEVPGEGEAAVFVLLEALELLDQVELEFNGNP